MRYFTAVFGENHRRVAQGLVRSFNRYGPDTPLTVFTDLTDLNFNTVPRQLMELLDAYPPFYHTEAKRNVFKYRLFREMQTRFPRETIAWIDADMLVFDDLDKHLVEGVVNVIAHGRRPGQVVNCGDGLQVQGERYAVGGLFALPPGPALDYLEETTLRRPRWIDSGEPNHRIGDQLIFNHLVARGPCEVHWVTDDERFIYNLEVGDNLPPVVGDERLSRLSWYGRSPVTDGRRVVVFYWVKKQLDLHIDNRFATFRRGVAWRLRRLYRESPSAKTNPNGWKTDQRCRRTR